MAAMHFLHGYLFLILLWVYPDPDRIFVETPRCVDAPPSKREALHKIYTAEIGVHEATGHNDGKRVEEYLRYCGVGKGNSWCSAFACWCLGKAGLENPKNPWAPAMFPADRLTAVPQHGDVFGLYLPELKRIGHCGFIDRCDGKWVITVEGNSDNAVVRKRRLVSTIYRISNWVDGPMVTLTDNY